MRLSKVWLWMVLAVMVLPPVAAPAAVDMKIARDLKLAAAPLDVAVAPDGRNIYVLTASGEVLVFDAQGNQEDVIAVGKDIKAIAIGAGGDTLVLVSPDQQRVRLADLEFIHAINTAGSPFKGKAEAPVVVAVFSDFQ